MSMSPAALASTSFIQGQVLSMIHSYTCLTGQSPTELELQCYFSVYSGPSIENILEYLESCKLIQRVPHTPRGIKLLIDPEDLPTLQPGRAIRIANCDQYRVEG